MKEKKKEKVHLRDKRKVISLVNVNKSYTTKSKIINVLSNVNVNFYNYNFYAIMGHSGSGKSTLINILGLIDNCDDGQYEIFDKNTYALNDAELSKLRLENIGFVFQNFNLNSNLKAYENVMVPMLINEKINTNERKKRAIELLEMVGLNERIEHFPKQLSGGEQQRVAIARALANDPSIILADEPTGNLDEKTEKEIFQLLKQLSLNGKCIIVVSHSDFVKKYADKIYKIVKGKLVGDEL